MIDKSATLDAFLMAAAARQPAPGGGSVAALAGALAASMGEMVLQYSVGKKGLEAHQPELKTALAELTRARLMLLELMVEDQAAFEALSATRKIASSPEYSVALDACIRIPQAVGATAVAILDLCDRLVEKVNVHLLSDLAVSAELAMATVRCAGYNVRVNLADIKDDQVRRDIESQSQRLLSHGITVIRRLIPRIWARQG